MLFPLVLAGVQGIIYGFTSLLKVKKVDAWETTHELEQMGKGKKTLSLFGKVHATKTAQGIDFDALINSPPQTEHLELPPAEELPNLMSTAPPPLPAGLVADTFNQQPVVSETVDMSLSQQGDEYE